ncbi:NINE protein [Marinoscillum sp.]|uniref:NINE protein n=1 Tax=Marinoscillum sp. TaxID=2024838 RepID=UPI003BAB7845
MKKSILLVVAMMFAVAGFSNSKYTIDDNQVETVIEQSVQVDFNLSQEQVDGILGTTAIQGEPNAWVAFALAWVVGWTGVHRVYLGGKGGLILIYIITCGGIFGIVPLIDWIVLLVGAIKGDISQFVDNDKFFMW